MDKFKIVFFSSMPPNYKRGSYTSYVSIHALVGYGKLSIRYSKFIVKHSKLNIKHKVDSEHSAKGNQNSQLTFVVSVCGSKTGGMVGKIDIGGYFK